MSNRDSRVIPNRAARVHEAPHQIDVLPKAETRIKAADVVDRRASSDKRCSRDVGRRPSRSDIGRLSAEVKRREVSLVALDHRRTDAASNPGGDGDHSRICEVPDEVGQKVRSRLNVCVDERHEICLDGRKAHHPSNTRTTGLFASDHGGVRRSDRGCRTVIDYDNRHIRQGCQKPLQPSRLVLDWYHHSDANLRQWGLPPVSQLGVDHAGVEKASSEGSGNGGLTDGFAREPARHCFRASLGQANDPQRGSADKQLGVVDDP